MKSTIQKIVILIAMMVSIACSQRYRTTDVEGLTFDPSVMMDDLNQSMSSNSALSETVQNKMTSIFYAENNIGLGIVENIIAVPALDLWLGSEFQGMTNTDFDIQNVKVFFVDLNAADVRENFLVIKITPHEGSEVTRVFVEESSTTDKITDDIFSVVLKDTVTGTRIIVESSDLEEGSTDLSATIQLDLFIDYEGSFQYLGKIPSLVGFGG